MAKRSKAEAERIALEVLEDLAGELEDKIVEVARRMLAASGGRDQVQAWVDEGRWNADVRRRVKKLLAE